VKGAVSMSGLSILLFFTGLVLSSVLPTSTLNTFVECALVCSGIILMVHLADRTYFMRRNRVPEISQEEKDYMSRHLASHIRSAGISDETLSKRIVDIAFDSRKLKPRTRK
jgi:hypothetical protein